MSAPVHVQADEAVVTITLDFPQHRHALRPEMPCRLADAFIACRDNPDGRPRAYGRFGPLRPAGGITS